MRYAVALCKWLNKELAILPACLHVCRKPNCFSIQPTISPSSHLSSCSQVLRQYQPATFLAAQQAARAAAVAAGGSQEQAPLRTLRLDKLLQEVQVRAGRARWGV